MTELEKIWIDFVVKKKQFENIQELHKNVSDMYADAHVKYQVALGAYHLATMNQRELQLNQNPKQERLKCPHCQLEWIAIYPEMGNELICPGCGGWVRLFDDILYQ